MSEADQREPGRAPHGSLGGGLRRLLRLCNNWISAFGLLLVGLSLVLLLTFTLFSLFVGSDSPYFDIVGFLILPMVFGTGLVIVPIGIWWQRRRQRRTGNATYGRVDFSDPRTRAAVAVFAAVTFFVVLPVLAVSGYQGYVYTESTEFCAQVCHQVMEPQATAHATSAHARVACAHCHIGEGAEWFVKSKLSGTRQVLAVWLDSYSRPIPPAIEHLRPARDTCEECHWPERFFGAQYRERVHFSSDRQNTRRVVRMVVNTGGFNRATGRESGIHMHMLTAGKIEYVATDDRLQQIPWVRFTARAGGVRVYRSDGEPHDAPPPDGIRRTIDCMDCHNRGAHHFRAPTAAVDSYLSAGRLDPDLPYVRQAALVALSQDYGSAAESDAGIAAAMRQFYDQDPGDKVAVSAERLAAAVERVREIYERNYFPYMRVTWRTYPENVGHLDSPGCFRCHDGRHVDEHGTTITSGCNTCHTFLNADPNAPDTYVEGTFEHTMSLRGHEDLRCSQCHDGGRLPLCYQCHNEMGGISPDTQALFRRETSDLRLLR